MERKLYGYLIDNDFQLDIANRRLVRIYATSPKHSIFFGAVILNEKMVHLLVFLLKHGRHNKQTKEAILKNVWEGNDRVSSNQRLWETIKELRLKLTSIGLPHDFIVNVKGVGYTLNSHAITPLFYE